MERKLLYANNAIAVSWALLTGHRMQFEKHPGFKGEGAYVYTPNHSSTLDMLILSFSLRYGVRILIKEELRDNILLGALFRKIGIFVDRNNKESRREAMVELTALTQRGVSLLLFPEGTRNRTEEPLQPFYDGAFRLAIEAQIPVVPIVLLNSHYLMPASGWTVMPGLLKVVYLKPVETRGMGKEDIAELKAKVHARMLERILAFEEARR